MEGLTGLSNRRIMILVSWTAQTKGTTMPAKKFFMVLDTETCSDYVFDCGFTLVDRKGKIYETGSFVVAEFINNPHLLDMFNDPFTRTKIAQYYYHLYMRDNSFTVISFDELHNIINKVCAEYHPTVCAYNLAFDLSHLNKTSQYFDKGEKFFRDNTLDYIDLWNSAMSVITTKSYVKFCVENNFFTPKHNIRTDAETVYRFISGNIDFEEKHTAFEDTIIETEILMSCLKKHKRFDKSIVGMVMHNLNWKKIQEMK